MSFFPMWARAKCGAATSATSLDCERWRPLSYSLQSEAARSLASLLLLSGAILALPGIAGAQTAGPATPRVGTPSAPEPSLQREIAGPPAPLPALAPRTGPLPSALTLEQALEEAEARSPAILAARANVDAAEARIRQAGARPNPELSIEVENFLGSGPYSGLDGTETTVAVNQRLDLGGRRSSRVRAARANHQVERLRLSIARADLALAVREQFATAVATRERLRLARANEDRSRELARIANILVEAGREPPLRGIRARAAAAQAAAALRSAEAQEAVARRTLASLFGINTPPEAVIGSMVGQPVLTREASETLEVRLAAAELIAAEAAVGQEVAARRLDPAVGVGVRRIHETGDQALVAGLSVPIPIFDRNRGNIEAARAGVRAADARRAGALAIATARISNASATLEASEAQVQALEGAAVPEAAEALRLAQLSYQAGKITLLELLDAQQAHAAAQNELIEARLAQAQAAAALARAGAQ